LGVMTGAMVAADDVMDKSYVYEPGLLGIPTFQGVSREFRDGSQTFEEAKHVDFGGFGAATNATSKFVTMGSRVPSGKAFWDLVKNKVLKGGQWMRKNKKEYLELDPSKVKIPTTTSRGKPFSPKVEPNAKSKWAKVMELFGNFDDPRF
ncbi:MAG TPA: hypothetical protein PKD85_22865, partial [Saprospiraceae bacterium]|nr:hypothetical protein [Saprospiraceae bacterium]